MDGRIEHGFRARFRALAVVEGRSDPGGWAAQRVGALIGLARSEGAAPARVLFEAWGREIRAARSAWTSRERGGGSTLPPGAWLDDSDPPRFLCDRSLGGLARWLRAAGYEAALAPEVPGHRLPDEALGRGLVLLTTEAEALDRRMVADGRLVVVWVPSALTMAEQLHMAALDLGLSLRTPRCMACGGALRPTSKEEVRPRIPPRTALWKDEYFVCAGCDGLFWRGTHWERIEATLRRAVVA